MPGSITLYIGPTKAGKTTELLRLYYCHLTKEDNIAIILHNSVVNDAFTKDNMKIIWTTTIEAIVTSELFQKSNIILIDNLQLFADCFILNILANKMDKKFMELIRICKQYESIDKKILSVNYCNDRRYDAIGNICSHNHEIFQTMMSLADLKEILDHPNLTDFDVIMIDEVQFLKNGLQTIKVLVEDMGKIVITSGLDGDYLQQPFGDVCHLIAFADKFTKLNAVCKLTKEDASFSKRIIASESKEYIGADEAYVAASRFYLTN